ncbi:MAG: hypothetical protein K6G80_00255 [Treponema sp.]|nr:hypothetical protein [Treponema sp.]
MNRMKKFCGKTAAVTVFFLTAVCGHAETKAGKVTSLNLDPQTNQTTVTVTLGELQLPERGQRKEKKSDDKERDIVTLGTETVSFTLDDSVSVELFRPEPSKAEPSKNDEDERGRNTRHHPKMAFDLPDSTVSLGAVVQLVYADDGKTVETVQVLPDMRRSALAMRPGQRQRAPQQGCNCDRMDDRRAPPMMW